MIWIKNLSKSWAEFDLRGIDLSIKDQEYFSILGPTGAGKSLLLETLIGLHRPDAGNILVDGRSIIDLSPNKRNMGMVFQDILLFPHMNVERNLAYGISPTMGVWAGLGVRSRNEMDRVHEVADLLGIRNLLHRYPYTLSRGEQQRVAIGRAIMNKPGILLLDEPLNALDKATKKRIMRFIMEVYEADKMTVVHVSHDQEEVMQISDRIAVLNDGKIEGQGSWEEIFRAPPTEFIARLVGVENLIPGNAIVTASGRCINIDGINLDVDTKASGKVFIAILADEINISRQPRDGAPNLIKGTVSAVFDRGQNVEVRVICGEHGATDVDSDKGPLAIRVHLSRQAYACASVNLNDGVYLWFPKSAAHVFPRTTKGDDESF